MIRRLSAGAAATAAFFFLFLAAVNGSAQHAIAQSYIYGVGAYATGVTSPGDYGPVAVADFNGDGQLDAAVAINGSIIVFLSQPNGVFAFPVPYAVGTDPNSIVAADLNGDGHPDLAVNNLSSNNVSVLINNGDGTFQSAVNYAVGFGPTNVVAADFNADGKVDLAVANSGDNTASVLLGNGDGTFQAQIVVPTGLAPEALVTADFNNNGKADLAMLDSGGSTVTVLLSDGDGTFTRKDSSIILPGSELPAPGILLAGDFNNDGKEDVVAFTGGDHIGGASIALGNGDGTFQTPVALNLGGVGVLGFAAADVNNDGNLDLVTTGQGALGYPYTSLGNGDGTFQQGILAGPLVDQSFFGEPFALADMNGDGQLDFVVAFDTLYSAFGNGNGTFSSAVNPPLGNNDTPAMGVSADFNGDGKPDIAMALSGQQDEQPSVISVLLSNGNGTFQNPILTNLPSSTLGVLVSGDFNGDGKADLAESLSNYPATASVLLGNGDGTFQSPVTSNLPSSATPLASGDFNGDGKTDLAVSSVDTVTTSTSFQVYLSNGDGTFTPGAQLDVAPQPATLAAITVVDLNGDGKLDIAVAQATTVYVFLGNGDGTFAAPTTYAVQVTSILCLTTGDFNGDGKLDLALGGQGAVAVLPGNGNGTFGTPVLTTLTSPGLPTGPSLQTMVAGDFNDDGKLDLAGSVLLLGNGDGTFTQSLANLAGVSSSTVSADFNSDGVPDLALGGYESTSASVYLSGPMANLAPSPVNFGQFPIGQSSQPQTVTLTNLANFPISNFSVTATGDFSQTNTCSGTLQFSQTCQISVTFTPTEGGTRNGTVSIADNAVPSPQVVGLTGTGQGPAASLNPTSLNFGYQSFLSPPGSTQTVTLTNSGNQALTITGITVTGPASTSFYQTNTCGSSLAAGASCSLSVVFAPLPDAFGVQTASLSISDNLPNSPQGVSLTGTVAEPVLLLSALIVFPNQDMGTTGAAQTVTLSNTGKTAAAFIGICLAGANAGDFRETNSCPTLAAGASCPITVTFTPGAPGTRTASINVTDDPGGSCYSAPTVSAALSGTGSAAPLVTFSLSNLSFATQQVGTASPIKTVTLTNTGTAALTVTSITASGDFFVSNSCGSSVAVGAHCTLTVIFKPTEAGTRTGVVTLTDNAPGSPQTLALTGTGTAPGASLAPSSSLSFGGELAGQSSVASAVTLTNTGSVTLTITSISVGGTNSADFSQQNSCGSSVAAGATCTINVTFKPAAGGTRKATLTVSDNAPGSPQSVALSATGEDFSLSASGPSSVTVAAGTTATYHVEASSQGPFSGNVSLSCSGAPTAAMCSVTPSIAVGPGSAPVSANVTVTTTARSVAVPRWRKLPRVGSGPPPWPLGGVLVLIVLAAGGSVWKLAGNAGPRRSRWALSPVLICVLATLLAGMVMFALGCGGSSSSTTTTPSGTPA